MEINFSGLKCDNCLYRDDNVSFLEYEQSIDKPCPDCGFSLLTEKDYKRCVRITNMVNGFNNISKWINPFFYIKKLFKLKENEITFYFKNKKNNI